MNKEDRKRYLEKSGDTEIIKDNLIENEHGFLSWCLNEDGDFLIYQIYGDGKYWENFITSFAKQMGCSKVIFATKRNPKSFVRRYGCSIAGYILEKSI